jgi:hypothetical protein
MLGTKEVVMIRIGIPVACLLGSLLLGACGSQVTTTGSGSGGSTGGSTTSASTSASTGTTSASSSGGGACDASTCASPFICCGDACVNPANDFKNCGACGKTCFGAGPFCDQGTCGVPACAPSTSCGPNAECCGTECCKSGQLCCAVEGGPVQQYPSCITPDATGTCPLGCPLCVCASPDTPIATPQGSRPIAELRPGDLVYSVDHDAVVAVPVARVNRAPVHDHHVVRVALASGAVLEISPRHPTADGRTFGELRVGELLDGVRIASVELIPYAHPYTYDLLPLSDTGTYYAGGARIGSTLQP